MAFPLAAADILQVTTYCSSGPQNGLNVLNYRVDTITGGTISDLEAATQLSALLAPLYRAWLADDDEYSGLRLQIITPSHKRPYQVSTNGSGPGVVGADALPSQVAGIVDKLTSMTGSRYRGRVFLSFFTETANEVDGVPTAAALALMVAWATVALEPISVVVGGVVLALVPVVWSRKNSTAQDITGFRTRPYWVTHKSRGQNRHGDIPGP
jgi:hypothetical protein